MFWKKKTRLEKAQEAGMHAIEQIQDALHHLPLEQWQGKLNDLKDNAGEVGSFARQAAEKAQQAADLPGKKEAIQGALAGAQKAVGERIHHGRDKVEDILDEVDEEIIIDYLPERSSGSKWLWIAVGMMVGAVIALLIAPASGRRSRAMLRDKLSQGKHQAEEMARSAGETVSGAADQVAEAAQELQQQAREAVSSDADADEAPADDETVADRVRTELGQNAATQDLERINVSCSAGVVTLHGPHLSAEEQQKVAEVVRAVPGVREVENKLDQGENEDGSKKEEAEDGDSKNGKSKNNKAKS